MEVEVLEICKFYLWGEDVRERIEALPEEIFYKYTFLGWMIDPNAEKLYREIVADIFWELGLKGDEDD